MKYFLICVIFCTVSSSIDSIPRTKEPHPSAGSSREKEINNKVLFVNRIADYYQQEEQLVNMLVDISIQYNVNPLLMASLIQVESSWMSNAKSSMNAIGYCQIRKIANEDVAPYLNRYDPEENLYIGTMFIDKLLKRFNNITNVLGYYNVGVNYENNKKAMLYAKKIIKEYNKLSAFVKIDFVEYRIDSDFLKTLY